MANILILTQFFPPETNAGAKRLFAMAQTFSKKHNVFVVAPNPGYPSIEIYQHLDVNKLDDELPVKVVRTEAFQPHNPSFVLRALKEIKMAFRLFRKGIELDCDLIIVSTPSIFIAPFAWILARYKKAKFIYDLRDLTWLYPRETIEGTKFAILASIILEKFMTFILRKSDLVSCATPGIDKILVTNYRLRREKVITVMNGISEEILALNRIHESGKNRNPTLTYVGLFGHAQGIGILLDVAKQLPHVNFYIIGGGPEKELLSKRTLEERIENLSIVNYLTSLDELAEYYSRSDILFTHIKDTKVMNSTAIPSKLFEYMAFERPIIYAGKGIAIEFLKDIGCAVTVPPNDPIAIVEAINSLIEEPKQMEIMGRKGRIFVEQNYQREKQMESLLAELGNRFNI